MLQRRGKKILVLDSRISGFLRFVAEVPLLREHGVEQFRDISAEEVVVGTISRVMSISQCHACRLVLLDTNSLAQGGIRSVVYLVRATIDNAQIISTQIRNTARWLLDLQQGLIASIRREFWRCMCIMASAADGCNNPCQRLMLNVLHHCHSEQMNRMSCVNTAQTCKSLDEPTNE